MANGNPIRWTPTRKAELINQIVTGRITAAMACARYELSPEELTAWRRDFGANGVPGLRSTRVQIYQPERRGMARALLAGAALIALAATAPAWADQITIGASLGTAYDLVSTGDGTIFADSPGYWAPALFDADVGTVPLGAHFGPTTFQTGAGVNGVFSVVSGGAEELSVAFPDGDMASGLAQITQIDDGSPNPHIAFSWDYTSTGDPAFLATLPGGTVSGEYIFDTVTTLLDTFVTSPGDEFVTGSAGEIDPSPMREPSTLAIIGFALGIAWWFRRGSAASRHSRQHGGRPATAAAPASST